MANTIISDVVYKTVDGEDVLLDLCLPDPLPASPAPLIVEIHGGGWLSGEKNGALGVPYAERGFATASINYRLSPRWTHPAQIDDCRDAIRWLRAHAGQYAIDPNRVGIYGLSAGGHLAALLGTSGRTIDALGGAPCSVQAVFELCGPADITTDDGYMYEGGDIYDQLFGGSIGANLQAAKEASAVNFVGPDSRSGPPFYIMHCADDAVVPVRHAKSLRNALAAAGADAGTVIFPTGGHGFEGHWGGELEGAIMDFFVKHLQPDRPAAV